MPAKRLIPALSYEYYANGACWWDFDRWKSELDLLASHGVNMPLLPIGHEAAWYYAMLTIDINREDAIGFLSGPAYYPYQLAGRLDSFLPMIDTDYLKQQRDLGQRVIEYARELGMSPILQGFNGHVPKQFKAYFPKSNIMPMTPWRNFAQTYRISPDDPLFMQVGQALREKQADFFGTADYYIASPFDEVKPLIEKATNFAGFGRAISELMGGATFVLTAESYRPSLLHDVNKSKVLIFDADGTHHDAEHGFDGVPFIVGTRFNSGGRTTLHGDVHALAGNPYLKVKSEFQNAAGPGYFPDSDGQNPLYAGLALEMLNQDGKIGLDGWLEGYAEKRYGSDEKCLADAMKRLAETCYSPECTGRETGSVIAARPSTELAHTAPFDTLKLRYDNKKLCEALALLLQSKSADTDGYAFDACDILRQIMSNRARELYADVMDGFSRRDARLFEQSTNAFLKALEDMDGLLNTSDSFRLETRLKHASSCAVGKLDPQNFEVNLLCQITLFGPFSAPEYYDDAWREWGDLVGGYYLKRWHSFFEMLAKSFQKRGNFSTVTRKQINGRNERRGSKFYKTLDEIERKWISQYKPTEESGVRGQELEAVRRLATVYLK